MAVVGLVWLGETLTSAAGAAVAAIGLGVVLMSGLGPAGLGGTPLAGVNTRAVGLALATACFTASYTLVDGVGARKAATASGFVVWITLVDTVVVAAAAWWARGWAVYRGLGANWRGGVVAGVFSYCAYWVAVWAMTLAPIAMVAALRETSVLFGMLIGALVLKERVTVLRWLAAALIVSGVVLLRV